MSAPSGPRRDGRQEAGDAAAPQDAGSAATDGPLVEVVLVDVPLDLWGRLRQRLDELRRELTYVALSEEAAEGVPHRLPQLMGELEATYGAFAEGPASELAAAHAAGVERMTVTYRVPPQAADAAAHLLHTLEEADDFCRSGHLLALAADPALVRYRRWVLGEFIRQIAGEPPRRWDEVADGGG